MILDSKELRDIFERKEELHPDLAGCVCEVGGGIRAVKHPLVFAVPYIPPIENALLNERYALNVSARDRAISDRDFSSFVFVHERPHRAEAFFEVEHMMCDREYWPLLRDVWVDTENFFQNSELWIELWSSDRKLRETVMDDEERICLESLDERVEIYRGFVHDGSEMGMSWTLSREKAEWFSGRYNRAGDVPKIATSTVERDRVLAYMNGRGEEEVVVFPEDLTEIMIESVS